ncbi:MAG TPA: M48 family metallopeptidase [Mycobacteriales bacterium]|nr:M48 family metallopeptidase [Mycobacteriales bacterium]
MTSAAARQPRRDAVPTETLAGPTGAADAALPRAGAEVEVRRSARRRRTVTAYREGGRTIVLIPARFTKAEERRWVTDMLARLEARDRRQRSGPRRSDTALQTRARSLAAEHLGGKAFPDAVRWVDNMTTRWGSCTPADGTIRISSRLRAMPGWVLDYVLVHELAHLLTPLHDDAFWTLVSRYPRAERARGYLEGIAAAGQLQLSDDDVDSGDEDSGDEDNGDEDNGDEDNGDGGTES